MSRDFTPREAGAIAWEADVRWTENPYPFGTQAYRDWHAGWDAAQNAWEDAEAGEPLGTLAGWIGSADHLAEARAFGLTALD